MPDITTTQIFSDGEKGITATKMNNIIANSVIQPDFVTAKPSSATLDPTDQLLEVKGAGTYARITGQQLIDSVSASVTQNIQPTIWSVRLRSFNAVGNPTFEVDQAWCGTLRSNVPNGGRMVDRWMWGRAGSHQINSQQVSEFVNLPGTNFMITRSPSVLTLATAQATLAAGDYGYVFQFVEGPRLRELFNDVHSVSILIKSTKANHKFSYVINDPTGSRAFTKLCTIPNANTWTLITIPNIPAFPPSGTWSVNPGVNGMLEGLCFGAGATSTAASDGVWSNGNFIASPGTDNWFSGAVNTTQVEIGFIQHEPGALCTTLIDCPFGQNLDGDFGCLRYLCKSYDYKTAVGTVTDNATFYFWQARAVSATYYVGLAPFPKRMAKVPTAVIYNPVTGAANSISTSRGNIAVTSVTGLGESGFSDINVAAFTGPDYAYGHYIADTGW